MVNLFIDGDRELYTIYTGFRNLGYVKLIYNNDDNKYYLIGHDGTVNNIHFEPFRIQIHNNNIIVILNQYISNINEKQIENIMKIMKRHEKRSQ